jgi:hypothetical protein
MFKSFLILIGLLFIYSFSSPKKIRSVFINYDNLVEGYRVTLKFTPKVVYYEDHIIGRGTIYFHHIKTNQKFKIYNPMMGFPTGVLPINLSNNKRTIARFIKPSKNLNYIYRDRTLTNTKFGNFGTTEVPFFFYDLNLDGVKELLVPQMNSGQRGVAIFKQFESHNGKFYRTKNSLLRKKPFSELDEMTTIDRKKKQIIMHYSGGYKDSYDVVYEISK